MSHAGSEQGISFMIDSSREEFLSYGELLEASSRRLAAYQAAGVSQGDELMLLFSSSRPFVIAYWACLLGGIIPVPLSYPDQQANTLKVFGVWAILERPWIASDSDKLAAKLAACGEETKSSEAAERMTARLLLSGEEPARLAEARLAQPQPQDIALIQFSSGSTGNPKGVKLTHENLLHNIDGLVEAFGIDKADSFLSWLPMTHDFGMIAFHLTPVVLGTGQCNIGMNSFIWNPSLWLSAAHKKRANVLGSPNFGYRHFLKRFRRSVAQTEGWDLCCVRLIINGAEPISTRVCQEFVSELAEWSLSPTCITPGYGLAEATLVATGAKYSDELVSWTIDRRRVSTGERARFVQPDDVDAMEVVGCGAPIKYTQIRIVGQDGEELAEDIIGRVQVRGSCVTSGYYRDESATMQAITAEGWLDTQDLGFIRGGQMVFVGRVKEIIVIGGVNYFPQDIENVILRGMGEDQLNKYVACGVPNADSGTEDLLIFVYYKGKREGFAPIAEKVGSLVLEGMGISAAHVLPVKHIPKTTSGKMQRYKLAQDFMAGAFGDFAAPVQRQAMPVAIMAAAKDPWLQAVREETELLLNDSAIDADRGFFDLGLSSMKLLLLQERLERRLGVRLTWTAALDYPTIRGLAAYLKSREREPDRPADIPAPVADKEGGPSNAASTADTRDSGGIAIVGMACRLPGGVDSLEAYWHLLRDSVDPIRDIPQERWHDDPHARDALATRRGGFLDDIDRFDPLFFGISPKEAESIDPQHRMLLELTWQAMEDAGWDPTSLAGSRTGVFVGISGSDYAQVGRDNGEPPGPYTFLGTMLNSAAGRLSYCFGLQGPSMAIDAACASSLVSVNESIVQLRGGGCDVAVAAGVNLILRAEAHASFTSLQALSPSGRCSSYDEAADGYIRSEGGAVVVLKRLEDARRDGDRVWAVIRGSAVGHNGRSGGLTVPSGTAQQRVIREALADAALQPQQIDYVEGHGSATRIGDPQEINALAEVFAGRSDTLYVGSVKSNIGHLEAAAGMASLIKVVLAMHHEQLPANLHYRQGNPLVPWDELPIRVPQRLTPWRARDGVRRAGISSFGISGANAHLIVESAEQAQAVLPPGDGRELHIAALSARSDAALRRYAQELRAWCEQPSADIAAVCRQLNRGRAALPCRLAVTADSIEALIARLDQILSEYSDIKSGRESSEPKQLVFLFSGQGSQYHGMARELYAHSPVFRIKMETLDRAFMPHIGVSLIGLLHGDELSYLERPLYTQPLIFAVELALAQFWLSLGVEPDLIIGHSIGEYAAACLDGVLSEADGVAMVAARAKIMDKTPQSGRMVGILADEAQVREWIKDYDDVSIAAVNAPENVTVSGSNDSLDALIKRAQRARVFVQELDVSHPFHSVLMHEGAEQLRAELSGVEFHAPTNRLISSMTGTYARDSAIDDAAYWSAHLVQPVLYAKAIRTAIQAGGAQFLEIGATAALCGLAAQNAEDGERLFLPSLRRNVPEWRQIYDSLGRLWESGYPIRWSGLYPGSFARVPGLPHTPYDRAKVWYGSGQPQASPPERPDGRAVGRQAVSEALRAMVAQVSGLREQEIRDTQSLLSLGLDSLMLVQLGNRIKRQYGLTVPTKFFYRELSTIEQTSRYLIEQGLRPIATGEEAMESGERTAISEPSGALLSAAGDALSLQEIVRRQLAIMEEQLRLLGSAERQPGLPGEQQTGQQQTQPIPQTSQAQQAPIFALSSDERRMYFMSCLEGGNEAHQIRVFFELDGMPDTKRLEQAFRFVAGRHEMLRCSFHIDNGDLIHHVLPDAEPESLQSEFRLEGERERFESFFEQPFKLDQGPLWRWGLATDEAGRHRLYLGLHHLIADGVSLNLILRDLSLYYRGLPEVARSLPFQAFVEAEQRHLQRPEAASQRAWWLSQLAPLPEPLVLPCDAARPAVRQFQGELRHFVVASDTVAQLKRLASRHEATTFMVLLASWALFLSRLGGASDLILGVPFNRRGEGAFEDTVGMCTQSLALRLKPEPEKAFGDFLRDVQELCIEAYAQADYPFDALLEELRVERDLGRNPLFDVMFNYEIDEARVLDLGDVQARPREYPVRHAQFDLLLDMFERGGELHCRLNYATPLYSEARINDWIARFCDMLASISASDGRQRLADIRLLRETERSQLLAWGRGPTRMASAPTAARMLADTFDICADKPALWFEGEEWTYRELDERAHRLAAGMQAKGARPGDMLGMLLPRTPDMLATLLASMLLGCVWIPLDAAMPQARTRDMLTRSGAKLLVVEEGDAAKWSGATPILFHTGEAAASSDAFRADHAARSGDLAYLIFTSGSTGRPKGVQLGQAALANFLTGMADALDWQADARTACLTSAAFDIFLLETLLTWTQGGCVVLASETIAVQPGGIARLVRTGRADCLQMTPTRLQLLCSDAEAADEVFRHAKVLIVGGEAFPTQLLPQLRRYRGLRIFNVYGPTETCIWSTTRELTDADEVNIGKPILNTVVYVLDAAGQLALPGATGDLWIGGAGVARGYIGQPELTEARFVPDPYAGGIMYATGDRARWNARGELECLGRADDQVKVRGYRIELGEVEHALRSHRAVANAAAAVREASPGNPSLVVYIQLKQEEQADVADIRGWAAERLPDYMVPDHVIWLTAIPQTISGKIDRGALPDPLPAQAGEHLPGSGSSAVQSVDAMGAEVEERMELVLLTLWKRVVGQRDIGLHDSFFDVGGNSYSLILLQAELDKRYPGTVTVADLFASPTVSKLKAHIESRLANGEAQTLRLSADWFGTGSGQAGRAAVVLDGELAAALSEAGRRCGLKLPETLLAVFALYLYKSLNVSRLPIWIADNARQAALVELGFDGNEDIGKLFERLSSALSSARGCRKLQSFASADAPGVRIGFVRGGTLRRKQLQRVLELCLTVEEKDGVIEWALEYGHRLSGTAVREHAGRLAKLMELLANHMKGALV